MTVGELPVHLKQRWPSIREQLLNGTYEPTPVERVELPKPDGGVRKLGIPSALDRFLQQAAMQVLQRPRSVASCSVQGAYRRAVERVLSIGLPSLIEGC